MRGKPPRPTHWKVALIFHRLTHRKWWPKEPKKPPLDLICTLRKENRNEKRQPQKNNPPRNGWWCPRQTVHRTWNQALNFRRWRAKEQPMPVVQVLAIQQRGQDHPVMYLQRNWSVKPKLVDLHHHHPPRRRRHHNQSIPGGVICLVVAVAVAVAVAVFRPPLCHQHAQLICD